MSAEAIARLRSQFEAELTSNPTLYHPIDIERVRTEDFQVQRFLLDEADEAKAFQNLIKALKWKQEFGIHTRDDQYFPKEFYEMSQCEIVGRDKEGRTVYWELARGQRTFKETALLHRQFVAHMIEKNDRLAGESGTVVVGDTNGASVFNIDQSLEQFKIEVMDYYPSMMKAFYVVDNPWLLTAVIKLIMSFMNPKLRALVHFVNSKDMPNYIDPEWIPTSMKCGKREKPVYPQGLLPLEDRAKDLGFDEKFVDNFYKTLKIKRS